ncbi:MAG TPA: hypothetical protein VH637_12015 [Streptosporangiaceae bacterium]|jgi:hypothetical protein
MTDTAQPGSGPLPVPGPGPARLVADGVEHCLQLAATWPAWDGTALVRGPDGESDTWTPHKAMRRIADHLLDHLHEVEALLEGADPVPDQWHGRSVTLPADMAPFTGPDLDEARSRLRRLARCYLLRYTAAGPDAWDTCRGQAWTLREIAEHVANVSYYADQVGPLS